MIEPAAIATASAAAVAACQRASRHIADSLDRVESGDINLPVFKIEIDSLGGIFGSISVKFSDSAITTAIQQSLVGCEEEYWRNVKRSMNDCEATLERVEDVLRSIYQGGVRPVRHGTLQAKSEQRRREIGLLKQHISMYRKTMELSLELIRVSLQLRDANATKSLRIRLGDMASEIAHLLAWFEQPQVILDGSTTRGMTNLQVCVNSAEMFVSTAISVLGARLAGSDDRASEHTTLTDQRNNDISYWVRKRAASDANAEGAHVDSASVTFDREHANLQTLLKLSMEAYVDQNFYEARSLLENFRKRSEMKYGLNFEERSDVLGLLATIYCRLADWKKAEEIVHQNFDGQESAMKSLVFCYWDHRRWDDAERILLEMTESEMADESDCQYILAELQFERGLYERAIQTCDKLLQIVGKNHELFYLTLSLLAQVYEAKGDAFEARLHRELLPPGIEQVCHDIDKLSRMWQDQAATAAQSMWSTTFLHFDNPVPWDEVKANIAYENVAGSGYGYTLLHAFVELGNELAVRFLIWKGADVNAKSNSNEYTPLHLAIEKGDSSLAALLLDEGADHLAQDAKGMTAWAFAIYHGDENVVNALVEGGANVNEFASGTTDTTTPLMLATEYGKENIVELLIKRGAQIEATDSDGNTALINASKYPNGIAIVKRLLQMEANVNASNCDGVTPLMVGVKSRSEEMVRTLLDKRPNLEARAHDGDTALLIAAREGSRPIVLLLLEDGAECVAGYPRGGTPQDVATEYSILEPLQQARLKKKKWFRRFLRDEMNEKYESARLAANYKVYEEREMRERRRFAYVQGDEDEEEPREAEELLKRMRSVKIQGTVRNADLDS